MDPRIKLVLEIIQSNLPTTLTVKKLASKANMSESHLRHRFKKELGCTPLQYIKRERLQKAAELLRTTFLSVKEVMNKVGIVNLSYFSREFRKEFGMSATEFRRKTN